MTPANARSTARNNRSKRKFSNNVPPGLLHYLPLLDLKSEEFVDLFRSFLSSRDERTNILALPEEDAKLFIEIIDGALRVARLEIELRNLAFSVLRRLCGRIGHLPESYLLSDGFDLSESPRASGGFGDVRMGVFKGKNVAVKHLRALGVDYEGRIRKRFCKEVTLWVNMSHPNVLKLIGVPDTLEDGRFALVTEWMANGNIVEYVRNNAGNHLKLLTDAAEGLKYLHRANIVHGDLKGANILITNANPVTACLADVGFMTIVHGRHSEIGTSDITPFMSPELLVPSRFGLNGCTLSKEADIYATGMVIYQVLTGALPFGELCRSEMILGVLGEEKPSKPANALELGLSDKVWGLLEDCWQTQHTLRPSIKDVLGRVKAAASVCGTLSPVADLPKRWSNGGSTDALCDILFGPVSDLAPHPQVTADPIPRSPMPGSEATARPWSIGDNSSPCQNNRFAESGGSCRTLPAGVVPPHGEQSRSDDTLSTVVSHNLKAYVENPPVCDLRSHISTVPIEHSTTFSNLFVRKGAKREKIMKSVKSVTKSEEKWSPKRAFRRFSGVHASPFLLVSDAADIAKAQARDESANQPRRPASMLSLCSPRLRRDASPQIDDNGKHRPRWSRFHIRQRLVGRVFDPVLRTTRDAHK